MGICEKFLNLYSTHDVFKLAAYCESTGVIPVLYFNLGLLNPFGYRNRSEKNSVCLVMHNKDKNEQSRYNIHTLPDMCQRSEPRTCRAAREELQ
jgi:hypothetical protein